MTIKEVAKLLINLYSKKSKILFDIPKEQSEFAPENKMALSNNKLKKIGWTPKYNIMQGYDRLLKYMKETFDGDKN